MNLGRKVHFFFETCKNWQCPSEHHLCRIDGGLNMGFDQNALNAIVIGRRSPPSQNMLFAIIAKIEWPVNFQIYRQISYTPWPEMASSASSFKPQISVIYVDIRSFSNPSFSITVEPIRKCLLVWKETFKCLILCLCKILDIFNVVLRLVKLSEILRQSYRKLVTYGTACLNMFLLLILDLLNVLI